LNTTVDGDARLWRVVDVFRAAALVYAILLHVGAYDEYAHPWWAWGVLAVMAVWTAVLSRRIPGYRRGPVVMGADLTIAVAAILSTRLLDDPDRILAGAQTLPSIWPAAAVLGWAVWKGWRAGLVAAAVVSAADLAEVGRRGTLASNTTANNIILLFLAGLIVGYAAEAVAAGRAEMAAAVAERAAAAERERLARDIHDSVLQVLGYVSREGRGEDGSAASANGSTARLVDTAAEVEARLRALISNRPTVPVPGQADLRAALTRHAGDRVVVSGPADPVLMPAAVVAAVEAAAARPRDKARFHK
jgi:signal transduction histidine kinase